MSLNYLSFFLIKVTLFMIIKLFTPTFKMKSIINGVELLLVGVNKKGHEVFTYVVPHANSLLNQSLRKDTQKDDEETSSDPEEMSDEAQLNFNNYTTPSASSFIE